MSDHSKAKRILALVVAPFGVALLLHLASNLGLFQQLEEVTVDWRFRARKNSDPPADPRILLVGIGEQSLKAFGRWEEWTRSRHAQFLQSLSHRPPVVVAYDFLFSEASGDPADDLAFVSELELLPGAITGAMADDREPYAPLHPGPSIGKTRPIEHFRGDFTKLMHAPNGIVPLPQIAESAWTGFVNSPPSRIDGIRRGIPLVVGFGEKVYPSFVLQMLMQFEGLRSEEVRVELGEAVVLEKAGAVLHRIPIDGRGFMNLNYREGKAFTPVDYVALMGHLHRFGEGGTWPPSLPPVEGQIVLIGQMAAGLSDFGPTPFAPLEPLVLVQAVALNNILQGDYLRIVPFWQVLLGWLPLAWLSLFLLRNSRVVFAALVPALIVLGYFAAASWLFREGSLQLPILLPILGFLLLHVAAVVDRLVVEMRAKSRIKNLFGTFAPPQVVEAIIASGEDPKLGGEEVEITAFFSDIKGFSTFSEELAPEPLVTLMNEYLTAMTDELLAMGGSLDKYIGDAIVGMFGAPLPVADHAHRACAATIAMQRKQAELCEKWSREGGWPTIVHGMRTRIGLNSGPAVVGHMGSPRRINYTMMGDTVNLAARCESGAKSYGVYTMVTGETRAAALAVKDDIAFRYLDKIVVKGRSQPAVIYEVLGFADEIPPQVKDCLEVYAKGMALYLARDWNGARAEFARSADLETHRPGHDAEVETNPSLVMVGRCVAMKIDPPGDDWDGRYVMTSK